MPIIEFQPIPEVKKRLNTSERRELAKIARSNTQIGPRMVIVQPGDNIQNAIDSLANSGGGIVLLKEGTHTLTGNISGKTEVSIIGEGRDISIIECGGNAYGLDYTGTSGTQLLNFKLADFTLQNSNNMAGIDIDYSDFWRIENVRIHSCDQKGLRIQRSQEFSMLNVYCSSNTGNGLEIIGDANRVTQRFNLTNCRSGSNGGIGYSTKPSTNKLFYGTFVGCRADANTGDGFDFTSTGSSALVTTLVSCVSSNNGGIGFDSDSNCQQVDFINCGVGVANTGDDFEIGGTNCTVIGCKGDVFDLGSSGIFIGNTFEAGSGVDPRTKLLLSESTLAQSDLHKNGNTRTTRRVQTLNNASGGTRVAGDVVILNATADGDEITTTTTGGDDKVWGMVDESISNANWGIVLTEGFTSKLKVDGTTDIAIGDLLSTFTSAGIAKKESAGDMCFAVALEAYSTDDSLGVIDALLFSPRLI